MYNGILFLWGGSVYDNNLYMLNITEGVWYQANATGSFPPPRQDFPYFLYDNYFYILPGISIGLSVNSPGCFRIDLDTLIWESLPWDLNRVVFAYALYSNYIVLQGGIGSGLELTNQMLIGAINANTSFIELSPHWAYPQARLKHSLQTTREYLWLFGGYSQGT